MRVERDNPGAVPGAEERAAVYDWLAGLFATAPSDNQVAAYATADGRDLLDELATMPGLAPVATALGERIDMAASEQALALDLGGEHARLFTGAGGRRVAPPCASFYLDPNGRMMQAPAGAMQADLRAAGITLADDLCEPPDHIAVQLALMAHLVRGGNRQAQLDCLDRHILTWVEMFAQRCEQAQRPGFYSLAARAAADFAIADSALLRGARN